MRLRGKYFAMVQKQDRHATEKELMASAEAGAADAIKTAAMGGVGKRDARGTDADDAVKTADGAAGSHANMGDLDTAKELLPPKMCAGGYAGRHWRALIYHWCRGAGAVFRLRKWVYAQLSTRERLLVALAVVFGVLTGVAWPINSYIFPQVTAIVLDPAHRMVDIRDWLIGWAFLGLWLFFANFVRSYATARAGEAVTTSLRQQLFKKTIRKELVGICL